MPLIPLFVQNELDASDTDLADRLSAFNFCDPFDHILPFSDGTVSALDRQHLWGLYTGIAAAAAASAYAVMCDQAVFFLGFGNQVRLSFSKIEGDPVDPEYRVAPDACGWLSNKIRLRFVKLN